MLELILLASVIRVLVIFVNSRSKGVFKILFTSVKV